MPCFHPMTIFKHLHGPLRGEMTFKRPWSADQDWLGHNVFKVPCGQCVGCRLERSRQWAIRAMHERSLHDEACFLTLTYADAPASLQKADLQRFWKRLRKHIAPTSVRYLACGEYGERFGRPHYHACVFGWTPPDLVRAGCNNLGDSLYTSAILERIWGLGRCMVGELSFDSAGYVARYSLKKVNGLNAKEHYGGRQPEFLVSSKRPAIGADWIAKYGENILETERVIVRGHPSSPPDYYLKQLEKINPDRFDILKLNRTARAVENALDDDRLSVVEAVKETKAKALVRNYEH